jgi:maltodextrin utilization protein YvdJ
MSNILPLLCFVREVRNLVVKSKDAFVLGLWNSVFADIIMFFLGILPLCLKFKNPSVFDLESFVKNLEKDDFFCWKLIN